MVRAAFRWAREGREVIPSNASSFCRSLMLTRATLGLPLEAGTIRSRPKATRLTMVKILRLISAISTVFIFSTSVTYYADNGDYTPIPNSRQSTLGAIQGFPKELPGSVILSEARNPVSVNETPSSSSGQALHGVYPEPFAPGPLAQGHSRGAQGDDSNKPFRHCWLTLGKPCWAM